MKVLDNGHKYKLLTLDGKLNQTLQFVKRCDKEHLDRFPGNKNSYAGTTIQSVLQCLCNRIRYLDNQIPCIENEVILNNLQNCLYWLELRVAKRHGKNFSIKNIKELETAKLCSKCGHTTCEHLEKIRNAKLLKDIFKNP